ncbi:MAG: hypothetical protein PHO26_00205 [Dehalococcoidia bacterium]|nr:hypothetical protein [Dehalococcoidia bacterium]MDD5495084.1 hypothetical protein [Dehalococcoidia bacterium]
MAARYERIMIDSFSTWHNEAGIDIDENTGNIYVINEAGLFVYLRQDGSYIKQAPIAALNIRPGAACVSVNDNTGAVAAVHELGLNLYEPSGNGYKESVLDTFSTNRSGAACIFHQATGDIYVVNDAEGLSIQQKQGSSYSKQLIDKYGVMHSSAGIALNENNGDIFLVVNHKGGGEGPYPMSAAYPPPDSWPKGDCLVRYRPIGDNRYIKTIIARPMAWQCGADLDINHGTGEIVMITDPAISIYKPSGDGYTKKNLVAVHTHAEGTALRLNEATGEIVVVTDGHIHMYGTGHQGEPIDTAMTRNSGVDVDFNSKTGEIAVVDNRGLTIYRKKA